MENKILDTSVFRIIANLATRLGLSPTEMEVLFIPIGKELGRAGFVIRDTIFQHLAGNRWKLRETYEFSNQGLSNIIKCVTEEEEELKEIDKERLHRVRKSIAHERARVRKSIDDLKESKTNLSDFSSLRLVHLELQRANSIKSTLDSALEAINSLLNEEESF